MDIAAMSTVYSQLSTQQAVGIAVMKKAMDNMETSSSQLLNSMVPASTTLGTKVDISV